MASGRIDCVVLVGSYWLIVLGGHMHLQDVLCVSAELFRVF